MELLTRLDEDLKDAMRQQDVVRRTVLRSVRSDIHNEEIAQQRSLTDDAVMGVIAKQVKQRRESIQEFRKGNRQDLVTKEESELDVLLSYMPKQLEKEELITIAKSVIKAVSAKGIQDRGLVMKSLMPEVKGKADGSLVNSVVTELLESL
ncbi:MAG: GatB/YqeY domain-containing protein [SAR202 cluster bacterium]|nr:GatB/YqeY domain-containing protein [SAR202 cluster bacterium]|tara:strand:- start:12558 stop:13007 length:450 start_codon:yes stop_codon:yes gene_type:complete